MKRIIILFCLLSGGCGLVPQERKKQEVIKESAALASQHDSEFKQHLVPQDQPIVHTETDPKTGKSTTDIYPAPPKKDTSYTESNSVDASSKDSLLFSAIDSIPFGVKLILLAIGLGLIAAVVFTIWWYLRRASLAVAAAASETDQAIAAHIRSLRNKASISTDTHEIAAHHIEIADLEAKRGKTAAKKK